MGNIGMAPVGKVFALLLRMDARQFAGGAQGAAGDAGVYLPLPGSSKIFVMFAGSSITFATQSVISKQPTYEIKDNGTAGGGIKLAATATILVRSLRNSVSELYYLLATKQCATDN